MNIVVITDSSGYGWHSEQIRSAFSRYGCETHFVAVPECRFEIGKAVKSIVVPGFTDRLPDGIFVRNIPGGTLEEVIFYMSILHALAHKGVSVCNSASGIERTVDKSMMSFLLHDAGIATPPLWVGCDYAKAKDWAQECLDAGHDVVVKPLFGSQGKGLIRLEHDGPANIPKYVDGQGQTNEMDNSFSGVYYLQEFVPHENGDWRVFVIGGQAIAAMERRSDTWIKNISVGGTAHQVDLDPETASIAEKAAHACGLDYAGIDLIHSLNKGTQVIEINSIPAWKGLQTTTDIDITDSLVKYLVSNCYALVT